MTEHVIFDQFMKTNYLIQRKCSKIDVSDDQNLDKKEFKGTCLNSSGLGHIASDCPSVKSVGVFGNSSSGQTGGLHQSAKVSQIAAKTLKPCPACESQHPYQRDGNNVYRKYFFFCQTFKNLSPDERTKLVQ